MPTFQTGGFALSLGTFQIEQDSSPTQIFGLVGVDGNGNPVAGKVGDANPDFQMSFSSDVDFHRFTLGLLFDWKQGGDIINLTEFLYDAGQNSEDYTEPGGGADRIERFGAGFTEPYIQRRIVPEAPRAQPVLQPRRDRLTSSLFGRGVRYGAALADRAEPAAVHPLPRARPRGEQLRPTRPSCGTSTWHRSRRVAASSSPSTWGSDHDDHHEAVSVWLLVLGVIGSGACIYDIANPNSPGRHRGEPDRSRSRRRPTAS